MSPEIQQNWQNFLQHHALGDWHGTWIFYSPEGKITKKFKCIRSLCANQSNTEISHQNHYFYDDNTTETKTFGPYQPDTARALFLENSFSWGTQKIEPGSDYFFETGFRHENRRVSVVVMYDKNLILDRVIAISEQLGNFANEILNVYLTTANKNKWQGKVQAIAPDKIIDCLQKTDWKSLEDLEKNNLILHLPESITISCPRQLNANKELCFIIDWQASSSILYRGIRYFISDELKNFTLQTFTP